MEDIEQLQTSDATPESSSETPQAEPQASESQPAQETKQDLPFHEHPRWKEVINQRDQFASQLKDMEKRFEDLAREREYQSRQAQIQVPKTEQDKLIERLKGIDPEFAERAAKWEQASQRAERLEQELQQYRTQTQQQEAAQTVERLHSENKVPAELQAFYQARLKEMANANPRLGLKDLPQMYKQVHENMSKFLDGYKRTTTAEYTKGKASDALPTAPKGQAPRPAAPKNKFTGDPEADRAELVRLAAQNLRAQRNS